MDDLCERIERAALLHDIGKLVQRANAATGTHAEAGVTFLERFAEDADRDILRAVGHHHADDLKNLRGTADDISYIIYEADNLAAASDRRVTNESAGGFSPAANLQSVFHLFGEGGMSSAKEAFHLCALDPEGTAIQFPHPVDEIRATEAEYQRLYQTLETNFRKKSPMQMQVGELLRVLEGVLSYVPSSTARAEAADISLYDHVRLTAAYAAAMYQYFAAHGITDYRSFAAGKEGRALRETEMYLLVSGDVSGIQPFIYGIPSGGALKSLRGRSFYLEILLENVVDEILAACGISRSGLLYTGGGHFYLLLPNTDTVKEILCRVRMEINAWLLRHFGTSLYLALAWTPCAADEFRAGDDDAGNGTQAAFRRVSDLLAEEKLCRYSAEQLDALFTPTSALNQLHDAARECATCRTSTTELTPYREADGVEACPMCNALYAFGQRILEQDVFCVGVQGGADMLPLPGIGRELYLAAESVESVERLPQPPERIYIKNKVYTGERLATHLWLGDYTAREDGRVLELARLAARSGGADDAAGIRRLGVLRADVDNLGAAFLAGFPAKYATLTRTAALSRQLSLFFKCYINAICAGQHGMEQFSLFGREKKAARDVHIVYSGGDDLFLLGAWDDIVELAVDLRRAFLRFTSGKLHFSAGIGFFKEKFPVAEMARQAGALESLAKRLPGKDAVALFGVERTGRTPAAAYEWDAFIEGVCGEKMAFLRTHFAFEGNEAVNRVPLGKSKAYQLLDLLEADGCSIEIARFAYVLARMERGLRSEARETYARIRTQLYAWYRDESDRRQLSTALQFIIYSIREKGVQADG